MSTLTERLNYILDRHTALNPDFASNLLPGLPRQKIIEMMKDIVDRVPEELIELYEWHNGSGFYYSFLPSGSPAFLVISLAYLNNWSEAKII